MMRDVTWRKLLTRSAASGEQKTGILYLRCQYLYFGTSKASKLSTRSAASGELKTDLVLSLLALLVPKYKYCSTQLLRCQYLHFGTSKASLIH
jgi:hypothetical protein